ncbi:hypothetical protein [Pseudomonas jilinensis]|uniref:Uncharacterized protein n=1 Tax=Pseudomonas jilinensis TaxID=2078689 RepID=A0A396RWM8_9PSED|nr:hypothetical protein [Pseudomonas jilinensis]RHW20849.1 hypothetical protein C2846_10775 [Pseudomonas jilinensis]
MLRTLCLLFVLTSPLALADESLFLCKADEQLIFGCDIGEKTVSLCASKELTRESGYVQYRFGQPDNIEFVYPSEKTSPAGKFFLGLAAFSGGGASIVRFDNSGYEYMLFDSMIRTNFTPGEPNYPKFQAGVVTRHRGKITSTRLCDDNEASVRGPAFDVFEREDFDYDVLP